MNNIKMFEGHEMEVFELNGRVLFNSKHVGKCLDLSESAVRNYLAQMNQKQAIIVKNSDVRDKDIRKLNNAGEKFLTESGVYKLVFKSRKPSAERFSDKVKRGAGSEKTSRIKARGARTVSCICKQGI